MSVHKTNQHEAIYRTVFYISIVFKGLGALIEILSGMLLFFISKEQILNGILFFTSEELIQNPDDVFVNFIMDFTSHFSLGTQHFVSWYLVSHGALKIIPIYGLLRRQMWSFPTAIVILLGFIAYQIVRYYHTHSVWLIIFSMVDLFVVYIIIHEYRYLRRQR